MKSLFLVVFMLPAVLGKTQNWQGLNTQHFNYEIRTHYLRPSDGKLYLGGTFTKNGDTILNCITYYANGSWLPLANGVLTIPQCPSYVVDIIEFNGDLYIAGSGGLYERHGVVKWNGTTFDTLGIGIKAAVSKMFIYDNKLYMMGNFIEAGGLPCSGIAIWDGTNWSTLGVEIDDPVQTTYITCGTFYNNELYVGGNFTAPNSLNEIAKWDGQNWQAVGNGFTGGLASVADLIVYNDELYASGSFTYDNGANTGNYMARWDGTQWHDVGGVSFNKHSKQPGTGYFETQNPVSFSVIPCFSFKTDVSKVCIPHFETQMHSGWLYKTYFETKTTSGNPNISYFEIKTNIHNPNIGYFETKMPHLRMPTPHFKTQMPYLRIAYPYFEIKMPYLRITKPHFETQMPYLRIANHYFEIKMPHLRMGKPPFKIKIPDLRVMEYHFETQIAGI